MGGEFLLRCLRSVHQQKKKGGISEETRGLRKRRGEGGRG